MQEIVLTVIITIQVPMPPAPIGAKRPEPVFTKEQYRSDSVWGCGNREIRRLYCQCAA